MLTAEPQISFLTQRITRGNELKAVEIEQAIHDLLKPSVSIETKAEFLLCLAKRGETVREIARFAILLRELALDPHINLKLIGGKLLDTCGTGADSSNTFNVSTATAFVLAAAGIPVAKHGNRSITSQCGSADVLQALGINIEMSPSRLRKSIETLKIGFLFAPAYHKTFKIIQPVRKFLAQNGHRTIFNLIGPLVNPACPNIQIIGVFTPTLTELYAQVLHLMKLKQGIVVHGYNAKKKPCIDEFSTMGISKVSRLHSNGKIETLEIDAADFGFQKTSLRELQGGDAKTNARMIHDLFSGKDCGPRRDFLVYNAAIGFVLADRAKDLQQGVQQATEILESKEVLAKLEAFRAFSKSLS